MAVKTAGRTRIAVRSQSIITNETEVSRAAARTFHRSFEDNAASGGFRNSYIASKIRRLRSRRGQAGEGQQNYSSGGKTAVNVRSVPENERQGSRGKAFRSGEAVNASDSSAYTSSSAATAAGSAGQTAGEGVKQGAEKGTEKAAEGAGRAAAEAAGKAAETGIRAGSAAATAGTSEAIHAVKAGFKIAKKTFDVTKKGIDSATAAPESGTKGGSATGGMTISEQNANSTSHKSVKVMTSILSFFAPAVAAVVVPIMATVFLAVMVIGLVLAPVLAAVNIGERPDVPPVKTEVFAKISEEMLKYEGMEYVWAGASPETSFDCSGLVQWVYKQALDIDLPHEAQSQCRMCTMVEAKDAQAGDLVFFKETSTRNGNYITHVGIYCGEGIMYQSGGRGVGYADIRTQYWQTHLYGYGRLPQLMEELKDERKDEQPDNAGSGNEQDSS